MGRASRARYATLVRMLAVLLCILFLLMGYVVLTSSRTGLSYAVARADAQREALQEETMRRLDALTLEDLCVRAHQAGIAGRLSQAGDFEI